MGKGLDLNSLIADPRDEICARWNREGFLEGMDYQRKVNTALVLESQLQYLTESGGTSVADVSVLKKLSIPLARRVFPGLIANDLVAVQPMQGPVGLAFALRRHRLNENGGVEVIDGESADEGDTNYASPSDRYNDWNRDMERTKPNPAWTGPISAWAGERVGEDSRLFDSIQNNNGPTKFRAKELGISVVSKEIRALTRKLRSRFPVELQQDLQNMHNIDIRRELTDAMTYEITAEIDQECLEAIKNRAKLGGVMTWTYQAGAHTAAGEADGRWQLEKYRTLVTLINLAANEIAVDTRIGAGNFVVASPRVCGVLESLPEFTVAPYQASMKTLDTPVTSAYIGTVGRFKVYRDIFAAFDEDFIVVGYKGTSNSDAGIVYAPYVPVMFDEAKAPESFQTTLGVMTRYAMISNMFGTHRYYRYINIDFTGDVQNSVTSVQSTNPFANYEVAPQSVGEEYQRRVVGVPAYETTVTNDNPGAHGTGAYTGYPTQPNTRPEGDSYTQDA